MEPNQSLAALTASTVLNMTRIIEEIQPDVTLVQGDTTTAMVAALSSFYEKVPVGHVEAGLRTSEKYDPFPEEINRRLLSTLTTYHFAPTESAVQCLLKEGFKRSDIFLTGNTVIDALLTVASRGKRSEVAETLEQNKFILVTAHRRENFGKSIRDICRALRKIARSSNGMHIVYPVHLNPNINEPVRQMLSNEKRIHLLEPVEYEDFVYLMRDAHLILTDSGGVQEEAPSLGKPVLVLRKTTERPEAVDAGVAKLVGTNPDRIVSEVDRLLKDENHYRKMAQTANPFGDGHASKRILDILKQRLFE
jgi:UDP-N-acetylglucosamine 2-epimerase (non-hydrolysing)